jgi:hypothetical protein
MAYHYEYGSLYHGFYADTYPYGAPRAIYVSDPDLYRALEPFIEHLRNYDRLRVKMEQSLWTIRDLQRLTEILAQDIILETPFEKEKVCLVNRETLRRVLYDLDPFLYLDVRQRSSGLPVYYLYRVRKDFFSEYSLVVDDVYQSSGYPAPDIRFVKLMHQGHEGYFLRLSQFREQVGKRPGIPGTPTIREVDDLLFELGRRVFQAAWHDDQRLAVQTAGQIGLVQFQNAIELLYLCLDGKLCDLRNALNEDLLRFFDDVYPQPAIRAFLDLLIQLDGGSLNELPQKARNLYRRLLRTYRHFLVTEVRWGTQALRLPLGNILQANFSRLHLVANGLKGQKVIQEAAQRLESEAREVVRGILEVSPPAFDPGKNHPEPSESYRPKSARRRNTG